MNLEYDMRFLETGPSIPNELLLARDEGRVVFFCGAGVSLAKAGLLDFWGLAGKVLDALGVEHNHPTRKIICNWSEIDKLAGTSGLISADSIFALIERGGYKKTEVESIIANALKSRNNVNLNAHKIMLDLANGPDGKTKIVTTNFDLLFEKSNNSLRSWSPPRLPDPNLIEEFEGIIHLHGKVNKDYTGADGQGFILSFSEFGRAYLSEAWATRFIKSILEEYIVVFVGYLANDPPVKYLLEALSKNVKRSQGAFAFQAESDDDAKIQWQQKGVSPIIYDVKNGHKMLWDTLDKWAERARDIDGWYDKTIELSLKGPSSLKPYERGQVAHVVSSSDGARKFAEHAASPPSTWICMFDPAIRFSKPFYDGEIFDPNPEYIDPFDCFGIDSDTKPPCIEQGDNMTKREPPPDAWNCFNLTDSDKQNLTTNMKPGSVSNLSLIVPQLPSRLIYIANWIVKVSNEPAIVRWAAGGEELHPSVQSYIQRELLINRKLYVPEVRKAWLLLFQSWRGQEKSIYNDIYELKKMIELIGWSDLMIREYAKLFKPILTYRKIQLSSISPKNTKGLTVKDMVDFDVKYPEHLEDLDIPDEYLVLAVKEFRNNVEEAVFWEDEIDGFNMYDLKPLEADHDLNEEKSRSKNDGLTGCVLFYLKLFVRLIQYDIKAAKKENSSWLTKDHAVFTRLRIRVADNEKLLSGKEAGEILCRLDNEVFWDHQHQCDLLITMKKRWNDFPSAFKKRIENRLLKGPVPWRKEEKKKSNEWKASATLNRIHWLSQNGCKFTFNFDEVSEKLCNLSPKWKPQHAKDAARSLFETQTGEVKSDFTYSELLDTPLKNILAKAEELREQSRYQFVRKDPFAGLVHHRPVLAFSTLIKTAKRDVFPSWAWQTFLSSEGRKSDKPRLSMLIARRICSFPKEAISNLIYPISCWLFSASSNLYADYPEQFQKVWKTLIITLHNQPEFETSSGNKGDDEFDPVTNSMNSSVGKLAETLFEDPVLESLKDGDGLPPIWLIKVEELLSLNGYLRKNALIILTRYMQWFYDIDPLWTGNNLIKMFSVESEYSGACWNGFLLRRRLPSNELFIILKPHFLRFTCFNSIADNRYMGVIPDFLLEAWITIDPKTCNRWVTNQEFRDVLIETDDEFRSKTISYLDRQLYSEDKKKSGGWRDNLSEFLDDIWPRQNKTKSPTIISELFNLAFLDEEIFESVVDIIITLIVETNIAHFTLHHFRQNSIKITEKYPEKVLAILSEILPQNVRNWPFEIEETLKHIGVVDPSLLKDERLVALNLRLKSK